MIKDDYSILLCTNGHDTSCPALDYGIMLANLIEKRVLLLGIIEDIDDRAQLEHLLEGTAAKLAEKNIIFEKVLESGDCIDVIPRVAHSGQYLTVVGPLGRPAWQRILHGRSFRRLLAYVETPLLYVPTASPDLKKMLICMGGLRYALSLEHLGLVLARAAGATVTLLHVVEPINLDYPISREIQHHLDNILETDTPQARNLRQALDDIRSAGLNVDLKVRHGNIVHEILNEVKAVDYDLVGMGSPYSAKSLRHLYTSNITAEVAEAINRPVLAVRVGKELVK